MADEAVSSENEIWKPIPGFEGRYCASSLGRIKSEITGKVRRQHIIRGGYLGVGLAPRPMVQQTKKVHRLICETFHGAPPLNADAAHADGNRQNNRASNLRWATRAENMQDAVRSGTSSRGQRHGNAILTNEKVRSMRARWESGTSIHQVSREFGVSFACAYKAVKRISWVEV